MGNPRRTVRSDAAAASSSPAIPHNVLERVLVGLPKLRPSDRRVAELILRDPEAALGATVADTARAAGVSEPTVMRCCAALGFDGFQDFKLRLAQSLALGMPATQSVLHSADTPRALTDKVFDYTMNSLDQTRRRIDHDAVARAIDLLVAARRIEFFGFGASWIVAADAQQKFPLFGVPCLVHLDDHQQFIAASMMARDDVAMVISNTGETSGTIEIAQAARSSGATVIALTGNRGAALARHCDLVLPVETLENTDLYTPTISRLAALTVIDVLAVGVAMRRGAEHGRRLSRMKARLSAMRTRRTPAGDPPVD